MNEADTSPLFIPPLAPQSDDCGKVVEGRAGAMEMVEALEGKEMGGAKAAACAASVTEVKYGLCERLSLISPMANIGVLGEIAVDKVGEGEKAAPGLEGELEVVEAMPGLTG